MRRALHTPPLLRLAAALLLAASTASAQRDSLVMMNGDVLVGELKSLDEGVAVMETDYSKNDFTIEWDKVAGIYSGSRFTVTLQSGDRVTGSIRSTGEQSILIEDRIYGTSRTATLTEVVVLKGVKDTFWKRLKASIDVGFSFQKENSLQQFHSQSSLGYLVDRWDLTLSYNANRSSQEGVDDIDRREASATIVYLLPMDWYLQGSMSTLSNTDQSLDLRLQGKGTVGNYLVHTNRSYLRTGLGLSEINERYSTGGPDKSSLEGVLSAELNLFDIGDLDLSTDLFAYPGLTEKGRWRADFNLNIKYDLLQDFYVKFNTTVNYDNRPAVAGNETYYVYGMSVGWELD